MVAEFESVDFNEFHRIELPRRLAAGNGALAVDEIRKLGHTLAIRLQDTGDTFTFGADRHGITITPGDASAETLIELDRESWEGVVHDLESPPGLIYGGRVRKLRGDMMNFVRWEPALRAMLHGRPIYDPDANDLRDPHGNPLDPRRGFRLDDDRDEMAEYLRTVGYLLVKGVFSESEVEAFREQAEILRGRAVEGDMKSWWGKNVAGESVLCRVLQAGVMPAFRGLPSDPRIVGLVGLADQKLVPRDPSEVNGVSVLWKNPAMSEGLSDLPWHRDCGMGGHAAMCPTMVCSIFLEQNCDEAGGLRFLPGSWQSSYHFASPGDAADVEGVLVPAEAGDLTLHYGDGWHAAPSPASAEGPFRSCVLIGFAREGAYHHRGERHYNDVLLERGDGQVEHMTKVASRF